MLYSQNNTYNPGFVVPYYDIFLLYLYIVQVKFYILKL